MNPLYDEKSDGINFDHAFFSEDIMKIQKIRGPVYGNHIQEMYDSVMLIHENIDNISLGMPNHTIIPYFNRAEELMNTSDTDLEDIEVQIRLYFVEKLIQLETMFSYFYSALKHIYIIKTLTAYEDFNEKLSRFFFSPDLVERFEDMFARIKTRLQDLLVRGQYLLGYVKTILEGTPDLIDGRAHSLQKTLLQVTREYSEKFGYSDGNNRVFPFDNKGYGIFYRKVVVTNNTASDSGPRNVYNDVFQPAEDNLTLHPPRQIFPIVNLSEPFNTHLPGIIDSTVQIIVQNNETRKKAAIANNSKTPISMKNTSLTDAKLEYNTFIAPIELNFLEKDDPQRAQVRTQVKKLIEERHKDDDPGLIVTRVRILSVLAASASPPRHDVYNMLQDIAQELERSKTSEESEPSNKELNVGGAQNTTKSRNTRNTRNTKTAKTNNKVTRKKLK